MALSEHYDLRYLDPDEAVSDFPSQWDHVIDKIDTAIHDAATAPVSLSRLPNLPASKTTSGKFSTDRIPNLPASKTTSGTFDDARIPTTIARTAAVDTETAALNNRIEELENANRETGVRNINEDIGEHLSTENEGSLLIMRKGSLVTIIFNRIVFDSQRWVALTYLKIGFRPPADIHETIWFGNSTQENDRQFGGPLILKRSGSVSFKKESDFAAMGAVSYITNDYWPSSLPGDPA